MKKFSFHLNKKKHIFILERVLVTIINCRLQLILLQTFNFSIRRKKLLILTTTKKVATIDWTLSGLIL